MIWTSIWSARGRYDWDTNGDQWRLYIHRLLASELANSYSQLYPLFCNEDHYKSYSLWTNSSNWTYKIRRSSQNKGAESRFTLDLQPVCFCSQRSFPLLATKKNAGGRVIKTVKRCHQGSNCFLYQSANILFFSLINAVNISILIQESLGMDLLLKLAPSDIRKTGVFGIWLTFSSSGGSPRP